MDGPPDHFHSFLAPNPDSQDSLDDLFYDTLYSPHIDGPFGQPSQPSQPPHPSHPSHPSEPSQPSQSHYAHGGSSYLGDLSSFQAGRPPAVPLPARPGRLTRTAGPQGGSSTTTAAPSPMEAPQYAQNGGERARKRRRLDGGRYDPHQSGRPQQQSRDDVDLTGLDDAPPGPSGARNSRQLPSRNQDSPGSSRGLSDASRYISIEDITGSSSPAATIAEPSRAGYLESLTNLVRGGEAELSARRNQTTAADSTHLNQGESGGGVGGLGGGLDAIDLTSVTDAATLRQREELDEEERRARRDASMKMEMRKRANQQMLRSTLADQQRQEEKKKKDGAAQKGIGAMQCVICMDDFTDLTATHCGHLFCHTCINEHLITAEMGAARSALCPFCRQPVYRRPQRAKEKDKGIVPLIFKVKPRPGGAPAPKHEPAQQREVEMPD